MKNLLVARNLSTIDPLELRRERTSGATGGSADDDATYVEMGDLDRLARLVETRAACPSAAAGRSLAVIRARAAPYDDVLVAAGPLSPGRHYSLALLALVDALGSEPSCSPLAARLPLDDLRAAAFFVASESMAARPVAAAIARSVHGVDRSLSHLRLPLRATGYLAARDALLAALDSMPVAPGP